MLRSSRARKTAWANSALQQRGIASGQRHLAPNTICGAPICKGEFKPRQRAAGHIPSRSPGPSSRASSSCAKLPENHLHSGNAAVTACERLLTQFERGLRHTDTVQITRIPFSQYNALFRIYQNPAVWWLRPGIAIERIKPKYLSGREWPPACSSLSKRSSDPAAGPLDSLRSKQARFDEFPCIEFLVRRTRPTKLVAMNAAPPRSC